MVKEEIQFIMQIAADSGKPVTELQAAKIWLTIKDEVCHSVIQLAEMVKDELVRS